jgi:hypothetical protein
MDVNALVWSNKHSTALVVRTRSHLILFITHKHVHELHVETHDYICCMSCIDIHCELKKIVYTHLTDLPYGFVIVCASKGRVTVVTVEGVLCCPMDS